MPTSPSMPAASARPAVRCMPRCLRRTSSIWKPDGVDRVERGHGLLEDHGDAVAADLAHLRLAQRGPGPGRSNRIWPPAMRPAGLGSRRRMESAVTLLPQPLSPTRPKVSPRLNREVQAVHGLDQTPARVWNWVLSPLISQHRFAHAPPSHRPQRGIEHVPQPVAEEVEAEHQHQDRRARERRPRAGRSGCTAAPRSAWRPTPAGAAGRRAPGTRGPPPGARPCPCRASRRR